MRTRYALLIVTLTIVSSIMFALSVVLLLSDSEQPTVVEKPLQSLTECDYENNVIYRKTFQAQGTDYRTLEICFMEDRYILRVENIVAGLETGSLRKVVFTEEETKMNFQSLLEEFSTDNANLNVITEFGSCYEQETIIINTQKKLETKYRARGCNGEDEWKTQDGITWEEVDDFILRLIPNYEYYLSDFKNIPYPPIK